MPLSFGEAAAQAVQGTVCTILAASDEVTSFTNRLLRQREDFANVARALRREVCNNSDDTTPDPPAETGGNITGGQCPTMYRVRARYQNLSRFCNGNPGPDYGDPRTTDWANVQGPIGAQRAFAINLDACGGSRFNDRRFEVQDANGDWVLIDQINSSFTNNYVEAIGLTGWDVERLDSNPDNCGDTVPTEPDYQPTPRVVNIEYTDDSETVINEDVTVTIFAPQVNLIGGIFAPVTVAGNTFQLAGTVNISPDFDVRLSPEIKIYTRGGSPDEEPSQPDGDAPEPTEDPNERRVIVGAVVTATTVSSRQDFLPQGGNPDIGIPNLGYCSFYIATDATRSWTEDLPVKNVRSYIPCPVATGAVDVAATGRHGVTLEVEPVWAYPGQQL